MEDKNKNERKRKLVEEKRKFQDKWCILYFVIEQDNQALCLICQQNINFKRI